MYKIPSPATKTTLQHIFNNVDIFDSGFDQQMTEEIIASEAPQDLTPELLASIRSGISTRIVTLRESGFKSWEMRVRSFDAIVTSFCHVVPLENYRAYQITCFPIEDDVKVVEKNAQSENSSGNASIVSEAKKKEARRLEKKQARKEMKKRIAAEDKLLQAALEIVHSLKFIPMKPLNDSEMTVLFDSHKLDMSVAMPSVGYKMHRELQTENRETLLAVRRGNSPARSATIRFDGRLDASNEEEFNTLLQERKAFIADKGVEEKSEERVSHTISLDGASRIEIMEYKVERLVEEEKGVKQTLSEWNLECIALRNEHKMLLHISFADSNGLRTRQQFIEQSLECLRSIKLLDNVESNTTISRYPAEITYNNRDAGLTMKFRHPAVEVKEDRDAVVNFLNELPSMRMETSVRLLPLPEAEHDRAREKGGLISDDMKKVGLQILALSGIAIRENSVITERTDMSVNGQPAHQLTMRVVIQMLDEQRRPIDHFMVQHFFATTILVKNDGNDWCACNILTVRIDHTKRADLGGFVGTRDRIPVWVRDLHQSVLFAEVKRKVISVTYPRPPAPETPAIKKQQETTSQSQKKE